MPKETLWGIVLSASLMAGLLWLGATNIGTPQAVPPIIDGKITCASFKSAQDAQNFFDAHGGAGGEYKNLDRDHDGLVCE